MAGRILLPFGESQQSLAKNVTMAVKATRGKNQAFVICLINDDGTASVATNMDKHPQIVELLTECLMGIKGN